MQKPPELLGERRRLAALDEYDILDTAAELKFDDLVRLASYVCGVPIASISLVAADRQWFKSRIGLDVSETSRDVSFCGHAIAGDAPVFEVTDANRDERFADNPLVTEVPGISFYAGAPLTTPGGERIGTICVMDHVPRALSVAQRDALVTLAGQVVELLELRRVRETERSARLRAEAGEAELRTIFDRTHVAMAVVRGADFRLERFNDAFRALIGPGACVGKTWAGVYGVGAGPFLLEQMARVLRTGERYAEKERLVAERRYDVTYDRVATGPGAAGDGILIQAVDVTERYDAETQIGLLGAIARNSRNMIGLIDQRGRPLLLNPTGRRLLNLADDQRIEDVDLAHAFARDGTDDQSTYDLSTVFQSGPWSGRAHLTPAVGEVIPCILDSFLVGETEGEREKGVAFIARDQRVEDEHVRRLHQAHDELAESRQRLEETLRALPVGVAFLEGPEHRYSFVNERHAHFFGGRKDFVGRTVAEAVPELAQTEIPGILARVYRTGKPYFASEHAVSFNQADGSPRPLTLRLSYQPLRDVKGAVTGIVATVVDVTDEVRTRRQLIANGELIAETQRLLTAAIKVAKVGFFEWRIRDDVVVFSEQMQRDWGIPADVPLAETLDLILPEDRAEVLVKIQDAIVTGQPYFAQYRLRRPGEANHVWIEAQGQVTYDAHDRPVSFLGTSVDITSRKTIETETEAVANSIPQMTWMTDAAGFTNWYNQRWYQYTGQSFDRVRGLGWKTLVHPDHVERVVGKFGADVAAGESWEDTFPLRGADGAYRWFLSRAVPLKDDAGQIVRWFGSNTDVTRQREDARELTKLAAVIESTANYIGMLDPHFRPIFLNSAGRRILDVGTGDVAGMSLHEFIPLERPGVIDQVILPALRGEGTWQGELEFRHRGTGEAILVLFNLFPVLDTDTGEPIAYATVTRDISERKRFETSLEDAKDAAERANGAKSAFLANMSHEIRSPLGAIMGFSDLIKNPDLTPADLGNFVAVIDRNAHHLLRIVDDILDLSKVEAGKMSIEHLEFSLADLLADFTSLMSYRAKDKGIEFEMELTGRIPDTVISDPTRLRQILTNVVGNAVKFTARGRVNMSVTFADDALVFVVTDTGPGIAVDHADRLFNAFEQADVSTTRKHGGTGLGLVLTRRLSEAMGGAFDLIDSRVGEGSTFRASVRVERGAFAKMIDAATLRCAVTPVKNAEAPGRLAGLRILVIEDSPDNQMLFELMLTNLGATIEIARDGLEGVRLAVAHDFDAVLCDVQMPVMDGYEATRELRERGYAKPIVALTAHAMKEERERALASGFTDFLSKPIHRDVLAETLLRVTKLGEALQ